MRGKGTRKKVGTNKVYVNRSVEPVTVDFNEKGFLKCSTGFYGVSSIKSDQEMLALVGVTMSTYNLLRDIYEGTDGKKISKNNRLLIFSCRMKLVLTYSALEVFF